MVCDLIDQHTKEWNYDVLTRNFNDRDVKAILAIPLSPRAPEDVRMWAFSKSGEYTVKTAYFLGKSCNLDAFHRAWIDIWKMEVTLKIRHFMWRACSGTLPVRAYLKERHMAACDLCPWCNNEPETVRHALFDCPTVRDLWKETDCESMRWEDHGTLADLIESWKEVDAKTLQLGVILLWKIWWRRNEKVFNSKETAHLVVVERSRRLAEDFNTYTQKI